MAKTIDTKALKLKIREAKQALKLEIREAKQALKPLAADAKSACSAERKQVAAINKLVAKLDRATV